MPFLRTKKVSQSRFIKGAEIEKLFDKGWYEYLGGQGLYFMLAKVFKILNELQLNRIKVFIKVFVVRVLVLIFSFV